LQDADASNPETDRCLCHSMGTPQVQADAPSNQGRAGLVWLTSSCEPASLCALGAMPWPRLNIGSRVTREGHARFWERLGVQFPWATRQFHHSQKRLLPGRDGQWGGVKLTH